RTLAGVEFNQRLLLDSPRDVRIKIPVWGEIDILEERSEGGIIITDLKTGNFGSFLQDELEGNEQMLIYWRAVRELYGVDPLITYFVSLSIPSADVDQYGAAALELDQYRVQAKIRFEEHFPELLNEMDDVWAVLTFLSLTSYSEEEWAARDSWEPRSALGLRMGIKRHLAEDRLIPNISRFCAMCPARAQCELDNPEDWRKYAELQKLGNVVDPPCKIPEEWVDPLQGQNGHLLNIEETSGATAGPEQLQLYPQRPIAGRSPLRNHTLKAKEWRDLLFFTPKEIIAIVRLMHERIPVCNGQVCPCKRTNRISAAFLTKAAEFFVERETHKQAQEAEGKTRSGTGKDKVKDLYDSQALLEILKDCPVEGCPFAEHTESQEHGS
ncbi:MAG: PD-(D/E)XK nuclease family protein, partial [bacterium]|nr:PD-(D/E)XK nuclease family protein [bacterium]